MNLQLDGHLTPTLPLVAFSRVVYDGTYVYVIADDNTSDYVYNTTLNIYSFDGATYTLQYSNSFTTTPGMNDGVWIAYDGT